MIIPVTAPLLRPGLQDLEYRLRPGMSEWRGCGVRLSCCACCQSPMSSPSPSPAVTLTWTSLNIDAYKQSVHAGLYRLEELIRNVNDIIENRIEQNLKVRAGRPGKG